MGVQTSHISCVSVIKAEDYPILIIHADAPVPRPVILEPFKLISWTPQVIQADRSIQNVQFANNNRPNSPVNPSCQLRINAVVDVLRGLVSKGLDHSFIVHVYRVHVNRI